LFVASTHLAKIEAPNQRDFHFFHTNDDGWLAEGMKLQWGVVLGITLIQKNFDSVREEESWQKHIQCTEG
jgi:hypothetical protein